MRSPADDFYYAPPSLLTRKGIGEAVGMVRRRVSRGIGPVLLDLGFVGMLWILITYAFSWLAWEEIRYFLVPDWVYIVGVIEAVALWESFGRSLGFRIVGKELVGAERAKPKLGQRAAYYALFHACVLPIVGLAWRHPLHEHLSGIVAAPVLRGGEKPAPWYRTTSGIFVVVLVATLLITTFAVTIASGTWERFLQNPAKAGRVFRALLAPDFRFWKDALFKLFETIYMAIMATLIGVLVAAPLSFFAARNLTRSPIGRVFYMLIRGVLSVFRSIEPIVWAIVFLVWVGPGRNPFAGFLALLIHSIADLTKLYAERLESIETGPVEAITATGGSWLSVLRYAVVPQIINPYISFTLYRWDINIRMSTIVGLVGGGGIGQLLLLLLQAQRFSDAAICVYLIAILVWAIDALSSKLRQYFEHGRPVTAKAGREEPAEEPA
jgi:phosphonate ABC transporter permease subunit PhnE